MLDELGKEMCASFIAGYDPNYISLDNPDDNGRVVADCGVSKIGKETFTKRINNKEYDPREDENLKEIGRLSYQMFKRGVAYNINSFQTLGVIVDKVNQAVNDVAEEYSVGTLFDTSDWKGESN